MARPGDAAINHRFTWTRQDLRRSKCGCSRRWLRTAYNDGQGGADTFVIGTGHVDATITDFTPGVDKLEFVGSAEHGNRTAQIRQELGNAVVTVGHDHVVLTGVDMHQLQPHDLSNLLV